MQVGGGPSKWQAVGDDGSTTAKFPDDNMAGSVAESRVMHRISAKRVKEGNPVR
jgi:hypothetical protein